MFSGALHQLELFVSKQFATPKLFCSPSIYVCMCICVGVPADKS